MSTAPLTTDLAQLRRRLQGESGNARLATILDCPDVIRVVRNLPLQDLYTTVREVGLGDALELIELLSPAQVQGFLDLDGWRHDRLDTVSIGRWLEALLTANAERGVKQLRNLDVELLSLLFKVHTRIYDLSNDEEPAGDDVGLHTTTPDGRYLVVYDSSTADDRLLTGLKYAVERMFDKDMKFILHLIEGVRWELPSALEEEAYRWRNARLSDLGFDDPVSARAVFAYVDPDKDMADSVQAPPSLDAPPEEAIYNLSTSVLLPLDHLGAGDSVLGAALERAPAPLRERVLHEVMLTANRLHMAIGADPGDAEALKDTVQRVTDTAGIALAYRAQGEDDRLVTVLESLSVMRLFQIGHSLGLRLQSEFKRQVKNADNGLSGAGLLRLDAPLKEVAAAILQRRPLCFSGLLAPERVDARPFRSLHEIAETAAALAEAAFRAALVRRGLGYDEATFAEFVQDDAEQPTHAQVLATSWAHALLDKDARGPLSDEDVVAFAALLAEDEQRFDGPADDLAERAGALAPLPGARTKEEAQLRAAAWARRVQNAITEEFSSLDAEHIDPRFVQSVWVAR